ncbi:MAG TPA: hypothetical protein VF753_19615 [Terriglobales bacterium]
MKRHQLLSLSLYIPFLAAPFVASAASPATTKTVSGIVSGGGGIISGSGFKVTQIPAGSGGTTFATNAGVTSGSKDLQIFSGTTGLTSGEWLQISADSNSQFLQITKISDDTVYLNSPWYGTSCDCATVVVGMTLWTGVAVTFDTPFSHTPSVTFSQEAINPSSSTKGMSPVIAMPVLDPAVFNGRGISTTGFQIYQVCLPYSSYNGLVPAGPNNTCAITWSFTAVGP